MQTFAHGGLVSTTVGALRSSHGFFNPLDVDEKAEASVDSAEHTNWTGLALVVGTGGIGQALADQMATLFPGLTVLTAGRQGPPQQSIQLDLEADSSLDRLAQSLGAYGQPLRLVFNCTGRLHAPDLQPEKRLSQVRRSALEELFAINAFGPVLLARAIEPMLDRNQPFHFASLSARVGSIGDNRSGGWYGYRAAKAAQNQLLKTLSVEWTRRWPQATVTLLHPGTTDTDLSKPFQNYVPPEKLFTPERAAAQLLKVLQQQTPESSGSFLAWDGQPIDW